MTRQSTFLRTLRAAVLPLVTLGAFACDGKEPPGLPGEDVTLAQVEGQAITGYDLERALDKSLGRFATASVERASRDKVLESLIESKAMAHLAEEALTVEERLVVDKEVASYRENLLIKQYLAKKSPPEPVTEKEIRKYYDDHPARFGATIERRYELVFGKQIVSGNARVVLLEELSKLSKQDAWKDVVGNGDDTRLGFATGVETEQALHEKLRELLKTLKVGQTSNIAFVQGRPYVGRIVGESKVKTRPLAEVEPDIRKTLQLIHTRDAIRKVGKAAANRVEVERVKNPSKGGNGGS